MGEVYKTFQDFCLYDIANKCKSQSKWSKLTTCTCISFWLLWKKVNHLR